MDKFTLLVLVAILAIVNPAFSYSEEYCEAIDPNSEPGCGKNCNQKCENINNKVFCPKLYCPPGCKCKTGYYYDDRYEQCVEPCVCEDTC